MKYSEMFRVKPGSKLKLAQFDAGFTGRYVDHESALAELEHNTRRLAELQH